MPPLLFICAGLKVVCILQPLPFLPAESAHVVPVRLACSANECCMTNRPRQGDNTLAQLVDDSHDAMIMLRASGCQVSSCQSSKSGMRMCTHHALTSRRCSGMFYLNNCKAIGQQLVLQDSSCTGFSVDTHPRENFILTQTQLSE